MDPDKLLDQAIEDLYDLHRRIIHGLAKQEETRETVAAVAVSLTELREWRSRQGF